MSILSDRLNERAVDLGLSQIEVARIIQTSAPTMSMIFNGRIAKPRKWRELADVLKIDQNEMMDLMRLATGEALAAVKATKKKKALRNILPSVANDAVSKNAQVDMKPAGEPKQKMSPVYGLAVPGGAGTYTFNGTALDYLPCPPALNDVQGAYATYVDGMDMFPRYKPGEIVWVHPSKIARPDDDVMVQIPSVRAEQETTGYLRRFVRWGEDEVTLGRYGSDETWTLKLGNVDSIDVIVFASKY